jgi:S-adenosylmethionine:tRNA-ribosyltransferase-isomerase (queuine synthetase)
MHPKQLHIRDYTYYLPDEQIARYPLAERDASRLLIYHHGAIQEDQYLNIDRYLPPQSLLIVNNTRVVEARLLFQKPTGAVVEIFCLEPPAIYSDMTMAMSQKGRVVWTCLIGGASKWKPGQVLEKRIPYEASEIVLQARYQGKEKDSFAIELQWTPGTLSFAEILHYAGAIPLPPYIKRTVEASDAERYQTVYAHTEGSVAAPTAGLHFSERVFEKLDQKTIRREQVTLHVGAGTFKPVKSETMEGHEMHAEFIDVRRETVQAIIDYLNKPITVVGTTSLRTVESLYWLGVKALRGEELVVNQWDAYELEGDVPVREALEALAVRERIITRTSLLIAPGYTMRVANALVTNFHQPQSTLLLLVAAFVGNDWRNIYEYALKNNFRFLSYGDGCLLIRSQ